MTARVLATEAEFIVSQQDILLGSIGMVSIYMHKNKFDYWRHTQLMIDVVEGREGMFSLEGVEGKRFLTKSRAFTEEEDIKLQK